MASRHAVQWPTAGREELPWNGSGISDQRDDRAGRQKGCGERRRTNAGSYAVAQVPTYGDAKSTITVLVADTQRLFGEALGQALARFPDLDVVDEVPLTGPLAVESIAARKPDVALLDYWLPGILGPDVTRAVLARSPRQRILVLGWFFGPDQIGAVLDSGACGFLPKSLTVEQIVIGIRQAQAGKKPVLADGLDHLKAELERRCDQQDQRVSRLMTLTPRELKIIGLLSQGRPVQDLAKELAITLGTLRHYIHSILRKTGARSQMEAVAMARQEGLIRE